MSNEEYFNDEEFRELLDDYEKTVSEDMPVFMDADDLADIADYYQLNDRQEDARRAIERAIELQPDSVVALNYLIHEAINQGDYQQAEDYLSQILDQEVPEYIYCRAEIWMAQGMTEQADQYLRKQLKDLPKDEYQDYVLDVANLWTEYGNCEKSMEWMMRAYPEETDDFKELMARTYMGLGAYDDSERIFNELIDKNPFQKRYWNALSSAQYMKEDYGAAVTSSEYAIAIAPDGPEGLLAKANALFRLENFEEALEYYERYSKYEPDDEFALLYQGGCLINLHRYDEAAERLKKAEEMAPADSAYLAEIYQELAYAYGEQGMVESALHYLDKTTSMDCDHADILVVKGHILLANGQTDQANECFKQAAITSGYSPQIMMRIAVSVYDNQYVEAAYKMFQHYFDMVDDDCNNGYSYMALCCYDLHRYDEYLKYLQEACRRNPTEARNALGFLFPEGMSPDNYYDYALKKQNEE
jgi:tetratricopeptide (TPR) repeat protein